LPRRGLIGVEQRNQMVAARLSACSRVWVHRPW
jgi:hypothetical protein